MITIGRTPTDIQSDTNLTPEEKREILKPAPARIKLGNLKSPYYSYGCLHDDGIRLIVRDQGIVNVSFEWERSA